MAFATSIDVADRLGRPLTVDEMTQADAVIAAVTDLIADAVGKSNAWAATLTPVPGTLKTLCVEKAASVILNPALGTVAAESLGEHSVTYARSNDGGIFLTEAERLLVRRAVFGRTTESVMLGSHFHEVGD